MDENNTHNHGDRGGSREESGGFLMLNKKERTIIREILARTLRSAGGEQYIRETFGEEYVQIGLEFLERLEA